MSEASFLDALVRYRTLFPTEASLGSGDPPAAWKAELDKVSPDAFDATIATSASMEGGSVTGALNFRQIEKVRALYAVRAELDEDYVNPYTVPAAAMPGTRIGHIVRLGL